MARPSVLSPASPGDQPSPVPCVLPTFCTGSVGIGDARSLHPAPRLPGASQSPLGVSGVDLRHRLPGHLHERQEVEFLRAAAAVAPAQEIQVPGHLGQGRGARAWPGAGQARTVVPPVGGHVAPRFCPPHLCTGGATPALGPLTCPLGAPWHCVSRGLGDCHLGSQTRTARGSCCPWSWAALPQTEAQALHLCPRHPRRSHSGSHDHGPDRTGVLCGLEREGGPGPSPSSARWVCQPSLPAPRAGSSREGTAWMAGVPAACTAGPRPVAGPLPGGG